MAHDRPSGKISQGEALVGAALALSCFSSGAANAGSSSAPLAVSATVEGVCTASTSPLAFGADIPGGGAAAGPANVLVRCSAGVVGYTVAISGSATPGVTRPGLSSMDVLAGDFSDLITVTITY